MDIERCTCSHTIRDHVDNMGSCKANLICSCKEFVSPNGKRPASWQNMFSLEDLIRQMLNDGQEFEVVEIMRKLPESIRPKYREIYTKHMRAKVK